MDGEAVRRGGEELRSVEELELWTTGFVFLFFLWSTMV
jgi:hypothetical protein